MVDDSRLPCLVPGCRRTTAHVEFAEWICGPHWRAVPAFPKRLLAKARRRHKRRPSEQLAGLKARQWEACRAAAIDAAAGNINPDDLAAFIKTI